MSKTPSPALARYLELVAPHAATRTGLELGASLGTDGQLRLVADILTGISEAGAHSKDRLLSKDRLRHTLAAFSAIDEGLSQVSDPRAFMLEIADVYESLPKVSQNAALWALGSTAKTLARLAAGPVSKEVLVAQVEDICQVLAESAPSPAALHAAYVGVVKDAAATSVRGSVKSRNGKYLEALILRSALSLAGLDEVSSPDELYDGSFCLSDAHSSREATVHEADATVLVDGVTVKLDTGFVGAQNPEVVSSKFSRYPNTPTVVLVDSAPSVGSTLLEEAAALGVVLISMDSPVWLAELYAALTSFAPAFSSPLPLEAAAADVQGFVASSLSVAVVAPPLSLEIPGQLALLDAA